jgi:hypothetical protein
VVSRFRTGEPPARGDEKEARIARKRKPAE